MSHNVNIPERAARRHGPAVIAIIVAVLLAGVAILVFGGLAGNKEPAPSRELAPATNTVPATPDTTPAATTTAPATAPASN